MTSSALEGDAADAVQGRLQLLLGHADRLEDERRLLTETLSCLRDKIARYRTLQAPLPASSMPAQLDDPETPRKETA